MKRLSIIAAAALLAFGAASCQKEEDARLSAAPAGAINGLFTVGMDEEGNPRQVYFSQGNLQYVDGVWQFAEHQYDYLGTYSASAWDLFGWSTAATNFGMDTSTSYSTYSGSFVDWGTNAISNGGNTPNQWRTLTREEWVYLFNTRSAETIGTTANARYAEVMVNNVSGVMLFPDSFTWPESVSTLPTTFNTYHNSRNNINYSTAEFAALEAAGVIFLPAAGSRDGTSVYYAGDFGDSWSATPNGTDGAYYLDFYNLYVYPQDYSNRNYGPSVRLVQDNN